MNIADEMTPKKGWESEWMRTMKERENEKPMKEMR